MIVPLLSKQDRRSKNGIPSESQCKRPMGRENKEEAKSTDRAKNKDLDTNGYRVEGKN